MEDTERDISQLSEDVEGDLHALRLLCRSLARLFTYPSRDQAAVFTDEESTLFLADLAERLGFDSPELAVALAEALTAARGISDEKRAARTRQVMTELFFRPCAPVPLEGRRWVTRDPGDAEARLGERASVEAVYHASGLSVRSNVVEPADALPTELDYVAMLLDREIKSSREGSGAQALVWKRRRTAFVTRHLAPLADGVTVRVFERSDWPPVRLWTALLAAITVRSSL